MDAPVSKLHEQILLLGPGRSLLAILSENRPSIRDPAIPLVVILNAGVLHRVGPSRMHVSLARRLAALGCSAVRFDQSGIGDSDRRPDALDPLESALADIRDALDSLETSLKVKRFILVGLCSGADYALVYAGSDARVSGVVLIDPHIPRTRQYYLRYYGRRLFRLSSWLNVLLGKHPIWRRKQMAARAQEESRPDHDFIRELSSQRVRTFFERAYRLCLRNDNQILAIFTAGLEAQHCYRKQLLDAFPGVPFAPQLQLEYFANADHMYASERERLRLIETIAQWLARTTHTAESPSSATS